MTVIGPNFPNELKRAGLSGQPFSWGPDGVFFPEGTPQSLKDSVNAVLAAHDPETPNALDEIAALEAQITPRRIREAVLGVDGGWLESKNAAIEALRAQL